MTKKEIGLLQDLIIDFATKKSLNPSSLECAISHLIKRINPRFDDIGFQLDVDRKIVKFFSTAEY